VAQLVQHAPSATLLISVNGWVQGNGSHTMLPLTLLRSDHKLTFLWPLRHFAKKTGAWFWLCGCSYRCSIFKSYTWTRISMYESHFHERLQTSPTSQIRRRHLTTSSVEFC